MREAAAVQFVMDAFGHLKGIGANKAAMPLLEKASVKPDEGATGSVKISSRPPVSDFGPRASGQNVGVVDSSRPLLHQKILNVCSNRQTTLV